MNITKFPLDDDGEEVTQLGLLMSNLDFMKVGMWPFIDQVFIMKPPKQLQLGIGWISPKPVQVSRYMACIVISGDNLRARNMVWQAHMGTWLNNNDNTHIINWGCLRSNLDHMEHLMSKQGNHMEVMVPTWRYDHSPFPLTTMVSAGVGQLGSLEVATGLKYSLDIRIGEDMETWTVDKLVKDALQSQAFQQSWGKIAYLTPKSRRSNGNQGKHDSIEATHNVVHTHSKTEYFHDSLNIIILAHMYTLPSLSGLGLGVPGELCGASQLGSL